MKFFEFYSKCKFTKLADGASNWDYYTQQFLDHEPFVVAIAKPNTGAEDCVFGSMRYYRNWLQGEHGDVTKVYLTV